MKFSEIYFKVRARAARVIFVSCFRDRSVYFHVNVTTYADNYLKFDSRYSIFVALKVQVFYMFFISAFRSLSRDDFHLERIACLRKSHSK